MSRIPEFLETLKKIEELHKAKTEDYAVETDPFSNFRFTELVMLHFESDRDKVFIWPIATKIARLANLLNKKGAPNNESIEDSLIDIAVYCILWKCDISVRNSTEYPEYDTKESYPDGYRAGTPLETKTSETPSPGPQEE